MSNPLFEALLEDHQKIRARMDELKREVSRPQPIEELCFELFRRLKATVISHAKAEEFALYGLVEEPRNGMEASLRHFAFEGYEEHDLIDFLMKEMGTAEELSYQWSAQVVVLSEMIEKHLKDEETEFFPKIQNLLSEKATKELAQAYIKERDVVYAKKTGMRPVISLAPSIPH